MVIYINDVKGKAICFPMLEHVYEAMPDATYVGVLGLESETKDRTGEHRVRPCWIWRKGKAGELPDLPIYDKAKQASPRARGSQPRSREGTGFEGSSSGGYSNWGGVGGGYSSRGGGVGGGYSSRGGGVGGGYSSRGGGVGGGYSSRGGGVGGGYSSRGGGVGGGYSSRGGGVGGGYSSRGGGVGGGYSSRGGGVGGGYSSRGGGVGGGYSSRGGRSSSPSPYGGRLPSAEPSTSGPDASTVEHPSKRHRIVGEDSQVMSHWGVAHQLHLSPYSQGLRIRPVAHKDADALRPIVSDQSIMRHVRKGVAWDEKQLQDFLKWAVVDWNKPPGSNTSFYWAIEEGAGTVLGVVGLHHFRSVPDEALQKQFFVTRFLAKHAQGRGVGTKALDLAIEQLKKLRPDATRVYSMSKTVNIAAHKSLIKAGFTKEPGTLEMKGVEYALFSKVIAP